MTSYKFLFLIFKNKISQQNNIINSIIESFPVQAGKQERRKEDMDDIGELLLRRCPPSKVVGYFEKDGLLEPYHAETKLYETLVNEIKPLNSDYFKRVLKEFTDLLDRTAGNIPEATYETWEWVYEEYVTTLGVAHSPKETDIIMYKFNDGCKVNIAERPRVIGQGSTGNRTWEASVYLVHYLLAHPELVPDAKARDSTRVIELGAGTGVVSFAYQQLFPFEQQLVVTDGDEDIARRTLPRNCSLNDISPGVDISIERLVWGQDPRTHHQHHQDYDYDLILGSDLTYDDRILEPLCTALEGLLTARNHAVIAATVRNPTTTALFEKTIRLHNLRYTVMPPHAEVDSACETTLFKRITTPISIYKIFI